MYILCSYKTTMPSGSFLNPRATSKCWFKKTINIKQTNLMTPVKTMPPEISRKNPSVTIFPINLDAFFCSNPKKILEIPSIKTWMGPNPNGPRSGSCFLELLDTQVEFRGPFSKSCLRFLKFQQQKITQTQGSTSSGEKIEVLGLKKWSFGKDFYLP